LDKQSSTQIIKKIAKELGFSAIGISKAEFLSEYAVGFKHWLENNYNAEMHYMSSNAEKRLDPTLLVENAKSVVSLLHNYYPRVKQHGNVPFIAKYAFGYDYHYFLKDKMKKLFEQCSANGLQMNGRMFVDSAPVLDRAWAVKSGLGWYGKNATLLNKEYGSFVYICELIVDVEFEYDTSLDLSYCGTCTRCMDACPTHAIVSEGVIDARRCISFWNKNKEHETPNEIKQKQGKWVFGCDICQDVCPWNARLSPHDDDLLDPHPNVISYTVQDWLSLDKTIFNQMFKKTAIKTFGYDNFMKNVRLALGD